MLTATVTLSGQPVTLGVVTFCDSPASVCPSTAVVGTSSLTTAGMATYAFTPSIGAHTLRAIFQTTGAAMGSSSNTQPLSVTGLYPTSTVVTDFLVAGKHNLIANVTGKSAQSPFGTVSFNNLTKGISAGTAALGAGKTTLSFAPMASPTTGIGPGAVAVGDFNRDGKPDLAVANFQQPSVTILLGNGNGTFTAAPTINLAQAQLTITVGDFNADGIPDLATSNSTAITVLLGRAMERSPQNRPLSPEQ